MSERQSPILIKSKSRFAVVGPGVPSPQVILTSGEDVDDLVGYYSVREAGLADAIDRAPRVPNDPFLRFLGGLDLSEYAATYEAVDVWHSPASAGREELYSLIFDGNTIGRSERSTLMFYREALEQPLRRLIAAYNLNDRAEIRYVGQMLSTFVSLLSAKSEMQRARIKRRQQLLLYLVSVYAAIAALAVAAIAVYSWLHSGKMG